MGLLVTGSGVEQSWYSGSSFYAFRQLKVESCGSVVAQRPSTQLETVRQTRRRWCQTTVTSYHTFNNTDPVVPSVIMWSLGRLMRKDVGLIVMV